MSAASQILAAIDECFTSSAVPPTSGDIGAAVLRALADGHPSAHHWRRDDLRVLASLLDGALSPTEAGLGITDAELEELFRAWWAESYPTPSGPHALMTHIGWARYLLDQGGHQGQQREQGR